MSGIKMFKNICILVSLAAGIMILFGCPFGTPNENMVTPEIRAIGLPSPDVVESVTLTVSGPNMETVEVIYATLPGIINISIPEGNDITFELMVNMESGYIGAATSFKGTATADVASDNAVITLNMEVSSTKLVVPDAYNYRIVQIDDMTGAGWATRTWSDLGFGSNIDFMPYDIDIDQYGNIYIANNVYSVSIGGIYVIDSIAFTSGIPLVPTYYAALDGNAPIEAVTVDKNTNRVYGIAWNGVYYWDAPGIHTNFFIPGTETVTGLAVDNDGNVYISGSRTVGQDSWIGKYSSTGAFLTEYTVVSTNEAFSDITILNNELYATKSGGVSQIEKFDLDLNLLDSYGTSGATGTEGEFVGPYNFVAVMNKKLTIVDGTDYAAQLISVDDINGTNWRTFGSWDDTGIPGYGTNLFKFFSSC